MPPGPYKAGPFQQPRCFPALMQCFPHSGYHCLRNGAWLCTGMKSWNSWCRRGRTHTHPRWYMPQPPPSLPPTWPEAHRILLLIRYPCCNTSHRSRCGMAGRKAFRPPWTRHWPPVRTGPHQRNPLPHIHPAAQAGWRCQRWSPSQGHRPSHPGQCRWSMPAYIYHWPNQPGTQPPP